MLFLVIPVEVSCCSWGFVITITFLSVSLSLYFHTSLLDTEKENGLWIGSAIWGEKNYTRGINIFIFLWRSLHCNCWSMTHQRNSNGLSLALSFTWNSEHWVVAVSKGLTPPPKSYHSSLGGLFWWRSAYRNARAEVSSTLNKLF